MNRLSPVSKKHVPQLAVVAFILLLGFALRTTDAGAGPLQGDEAWLSFLAYDFGHNGQRAELGVTSSANINQPPFFHDIMAIPFAFDPDPRIARLFLAVLQLVGMAILYFMLRRYWTSRIALAGLAIFAVLPRAVWAGRFLWNPYLAIPFIIAFLATGFLTTEGKRWARWLHFPILACIIGTHPILAITGIIWPLFVLRDWVLNHTRRQHIQLIKDYTVGIVLAGLVLLPWGIGMLHQRLNTPGQGQIMFLRERTSIATIIQFTVQSTTAFGFGAFLLPSLDTLKFSEGLVIACALIGWLTLLSAFFLTGRAAVQMLAKRSVAQHYPDLVIGLAFLGTPAILMLSPGATLDHYLIALVPYSAVVLAIILVGRVPAGINQVAINRVLRPDDKQQALSRSLIQRSHLRKLIRMTVLVVVCAFELAYLGEAMSQIHNLSNFSRDLMPPLQDMIHLRNAAVRPGVETIYLVDSGTPRAFEQELLWQMLANKGDSRVIWGDNFALPVPKNGATYVGYADSTLIPELYSKRPARIISNNLYRVVDIPPNSGFTPTCRPNGVTRLANGATILGYYVPTNSSLTPQINKDWTIYILWTGVSTQPHTTFQLFTHLVDDHGTKFAQRDLASLDTDLWRNDDLFVSKVTLAVNAQMPINQPLYIRVGMYTLPTATNPQFGNVNAINQNGAAAGQWITIPICESL
jgi:hypothetical protein